MINLGGAYTDADRDEEAIKLLEEALPLSRKVLGPEHSETIGAMHFLAASYSTVGREDEEIKLLEEALPLSRKLLGTGNAATPPVVNHLAELYEKTGRKDEAAALRKELADEGASATPAPKPAPAAADITTLEAALELARKDHGPEHGDVITSMTELAAAYGADGSGRKSIKLGEDALALAHRVLPAGDPRVIEAMNVLATLYRLVDRNVEATKLEVEMKTLVRDSREDHEKPAHP